MSACISFQHAIERLERQRLVAGEVLDRQPDVARRCGNGEQELAALTGQCASSVVASSA